MLIDLDNNRLRITNARGINVIDIAPAVLDEIREHIRIRVQEWIRQRGTTPFQFYNLFGGVEHGDWSGTPMMALYEKYENRYRGRYENILELEDKAMGLASNDGGRLLKRALLEWSDISFGFQHGRNSTYRFVGHTTDV
ncbi:MAG: hypothetical protein LBC59_05875 [Chitinispirillales bacterium]|jgi:hypothetical protein|nr:hypothetical protein [Chitinispirillales bacterium]